MTAEDAAEAPVHAGRRVHWIELLFDLVMVVCIGQIARTMHGEPTWIDLLGFVLLLAATWWAWVNASITMNLFGARVTPLIWVAVVVAMLALGIMAAAVPGAFDDRAAAFAVGNALIRVVWMVPWFVKRRVIGVPWWRPVLYNVVPVVLWLVSTVVPGPARYALWIVAIAIEVLLLTGISRRSEWLRAHLDLGHAIERVELVVVIVFGESVLAVIGEVSAHWDAVPAIAALLGFGAVALLAWIFFGYATDAVERGLRRLQLRGSLAGLRDAVMYLPFVLIAGVVLFAAGLGTAIADAEQPLPMSAALCIGGGVSLFFLASAAETLRYGAPWRDIVLWAPAGVLLPWIAVPLAPRLPATGVVAGVFIAVAVVAVLNAVNARAVHARGA